MNADTRWPRKGDLPFISGGLESTSLQLDWLKFMANDELIAQGFKEAADRLQLARSAE